MDGPERLWTTGVPPDGVCEPADVTISQPDLPAPALVETWAVAPGARLLWRGDGSFQLEGTVADGPGAVVVSGLDRSLAMRLAHRGDATTARPATADHPADLAALSQLAELGYVRRLAPVATGPHDRESADAVAWHDPGGPAGSNSAAVATLRRLTCDHVGSANRYGVPAGVVVAGRRQAWVLIHGVTRIAAHLGAVLAASGVGHISFASSGAVRLRDVLPGGLQVEDEGRRFAVAAVDAVHRAAPGVDTGAAATDVEPDLVVLCVDAPIEPELRELLHHRRRAHLVVHLDADRGEVGPLVVPGVTSCTRCADLHRLDRDPAWSLLAVQLQSAAKVAPPAEPALAAAVSAMAASHALTYLDANGAGGPSGFDHGSWELRAGWPSPRRRTRVPHPDCDCQAAWRGAGERPRGRAGPGESQEGTAEWWS